MGWISGITSYPSIDHLSIQMIFLLFACFQVSHRVTTWPSPHKHNTTPFTRNRKLLVVTLITNFQLSLYCDFFFFLKKKQQQPKLSLLSMGAFTWNPSSEEPGAGGLWIWGKPWKTWENLSQDFFSPIFSYFKCPILVSLDRKAAGVIVPGPMHPLLLFGVYSHHSLALLYPRQCPGALVPTTVLAIKVTSMHLFKLQVY